MDNEIDFKNASRRALFGKQKRLPGENYSAVNKPKRHAKTKITINLDADLVQHFKEKGKRERTSYQLLINQALREHLEGTSSERIAKTVGLILLQDKSFLERLIEELKK
ncbi:MAG: BrnA antitoxin family protein [Deltaproteobacteria bacterium]|jgi:uncharacterized protein (DUF4415 family)|nr:BrnA antitoxin family protein [Deltaproteobacteria bacterium]